MRQNVDAAPKSSFTFRVVSPRVFTLETRAYRGLKAEMLLSTMYIYTPYKKYYFHLCRKKSQNFHQVSVLTLRRTSNSPNILTFTHEYVCTSQLRDLFSKTKKYKSTARAPTLNVCECFDCIDCTGPPRRSCVLLYYDWTKIERA